MMRFSSQFGVPQSMVEQRLDIFNKFRQPPEPSWFGESRSLTEIHGLLERLTSIPNVYNITLGYRSANEMKGIKVYSPRKAARANREIVVVGGNQAHEWMTVSVAMYIASALSKQSIQGADVVIIPTVKPKQYELLRQASSALDAFSSSVVFPSLAMHSGLKIDPDSESSDATPGPVKSYIDKMGVNCHRVVQLLQWESDDTKEESNDGDSPFVEFHPRFTNCLATGVFGENRVKVGEKQSRSPILIELRDKNGLFKPEDVVRAGDSIIHSMKRMLTSD